MFGSLARRITRAYVLLALVLVIAIVGASTALAFLLYSRGVNDAMAGTVARVRDAASATQKRTLAQEAPFIIAAVGRSRFHVLVVDERGRPLAQNEREGPPSPGRALLITAGRAIGLPRAQVQVPGGRVIISADFDRFGGLLLWYWSIMLPIGVAAVLVAWIIARRITSGAIVPLIDVTQALRVIAQGEQTPARLLTERNDLGELTGAYNEVAYRLATANAERLQTEAQMRQFIADAGHELRTPLTIIMGYLDVLTQGIVQGSEGTRATYQTMLEESRRMRVLIDKLILLARLDRAQAAPRAMPTDASALVARVVAALAPLADGRIDLAARDEGAIVNVDEDELYEAVRNVLENAVKYAPGSPITVGVHRGDGEVVIDVRDEGPGMQAQDVEHAFDRFYRGVSRASVDGSGLGLAIARRAVERVGGEMTLQSKPGQGTRVKLRLPDLRETARSAPGL